MADPINLDEFKAKVQQDLGLEIQAGDRTFRIIPPQLMSDADAAEFQRLQQAEERGETAPEAVARLLVDDYDGFVAAGGSAMLLLHIFQTKLAERAAGQGAAVGESSPS